MSPKNLDRFDLLAREPLRDTDYRIKLTTSCRDSDVIPKVADAGQMRSENGAPVQIMHNGLRVIQGGYHGDWMAEVIKKQCH